MILDELVLHDFGVFGGRQSLLLTPESPQRPVVLVGGLNGGGKTTILEAIQLCLFGSAAPALGRGAYLDQLRRRIHRGAGARSASLELSFRHVSGGREHAYRVVRSWSIVGNTCREEFEVSRDGHPDRLATDNWAEQVEEFMPSRIAGLFLFDGERIESYADPDRAPELLETAVHNLLGLDIVDRLSTDLSSLERRKRGSPPADGVGAEAEASRSELAAARERRVALETGLAEARGLHDRATRDYRALDERFAREGGELYAARARIEAEAVASDRRLAETEGSLRDLAAGTAPLVLVSGLVRDLRERAEAEGRIEHARRLSAALEDEHAAILALPALELLPGEGLEAIRGALAERRSTISLEGDAPVLLALDHGTGDALVALASEGIDEARREALTLVAKASAARSHRDSAARALAAVPTAEDMADLDESRAAARRRKDEGEASIRVLEEELAASDREIARLSERLDRLAEREVAERFRGEDSQRLLAHSARVRGTLMRFREAVVLRHIERIERLVLESFASLSRKPGLLSDLRIDPASYRLVIRGVDGEIMGPEQLSAGERQLLAVALLWGLARASGRPLPTVIDTPLGRLDSEHRSKLVDRYFPNASHQVVLLSTDEEISGRYLDALKGSVGRWYLLEFDSDRGRTVVREGYLEPRNLLDVA